MQSDLFTAKRTPKIKLEELFEAYLFVEKKITTLQNAISFEVDYEQNLVQLFIN
jgi:hypothetical protein